ncbi:hypothetical protein PIROE2DRAFT_4623 [Piromyces sp. E2]|nr:hypothetical protein PIROE2DRAFT_4623 [Piromyces sp. E2]|eukprot:OUM67814.1 hypothetical protein PIROE2DRAFT_4623 [Piromyces sp. E2]
MIKSNYQNGAGELVSLLAEKFNKYSKSKNLDIELNLIFFGKKNSSETFEYFEDFVESHFLKKFEKYELIFLNDLLIGKFGEHLLDLKSYVANDKRELYTNQPFYKHCFYKGKWISLPIFLDLTLLLSNEELLNKYHKEVPKTWEELYQTGKEIMDKENPNRDKPLYGYNGLFYDGEGGTCSLYEYFYSNRNSVDDPMPNPSSKESIEAIKLLKKIKDDISSDMKFQENEKGFEENLSDSEFVFSKFWYTPNTVMNSGKKVSILPGSKPGISGSIVGVNGFGINKYVKDEKAIKAAAEIISYFSSLEFQKELLLEFGLPSGILNLYDDDEICKTVNCEFFKSFQIITRPTAEVDDYEEYSIEFRDSVYSYLYGNNTVEKALEITSKLVKSNQSSGSLRNASVNVFSILVSLLLFFISF